MRALAPANGTVTSAARPLLRVTPGTEAIEICKTRACLSPQKVAVGADGHASPSSDLERGRWFWRVAPAGPLWSILVRPTVGHSARVHGFDANGDGLADIIMKAGILFGATAVAEKSTQVGSTNAGVTMLAVGDIDGDGFDDAVLEGHVARGGPAGFRPESEWVACPDSRCGLPVGDIDGDGYADLLNGGTLQLGSPTGFRELAAPLLAKPEVVRPAGDLDGDGIADVVVLEEGYRTVSVLPGGKMGFTAGPKLTIGATENASGIEIGIGDIDGDGIPDIVTSFTEPLPEPSQARRLTVVVRSTLRGGDITHGTERRFTVAMSEQTPSARMRIADVDGDGFDDIVLFISDSFGGDGRVARGAAASVKLQARPVALHLDRSLGLMELLSVGDLNGDGRDDVVLRTSQVAGFIEVFDIHAGSKAGFVPKLFASYNLNEGDLLAERRVPRRPSED